MSVVGRTGSIPHEAALPSPSNGGPIISGFQPMTSMVVLAMFAQAIRGFAPGAGTLAMANASFEILVDAARACVDTGTFVRADPAEIAEVLWAAAHGVVSLEIAGHFESGDVHRRSETAVTAATSWFLRKPP